MTKVYKHNTKDNTLLVEINSIRYSLGKLVSLICALNKLPTWHNRLLLLDGCHVFECVSLRHNNEPHLATRMHTVSLEIVVVENIFVVSPSYGIKYNKLNINAHGKWSLCMKFIEWKINAPDLLYTPFT